MRVQGYRHGGAILITTDEHLNSLNVKHRLAYSRLRSAIGMLGALRVEREDLWDQVFFEVLQPGADAMPVNLYLGESVCQDELDDCRSELDGAIWFTSLLTRVDGVVLMNADLEVMGFGVEILKPETSLRVFRATTVSAAEKRLSEVNYTDFGTRHRSMMRYCAAVPGSIGFVISQDGELRVMTKVGRKLVFWDNVRLRLEDFKGSPKRRQGD